MERQLFTFLFGFFGALIAQLAPAYAVWITSGSIPPKLKDTFYWSVSLVIGVASGLLVVVLRVPSPILAIVVGIAVPQTLRVVAQQQGPRRAERNAHEQLEKAERAIEKTPEKARPYWDAASARLQVYFERNLSQTQSIFWITVSVLLAGFGLICYGVMHAFRGASIEASVLTAASGVVTEFIAATFLVIYKSTTTQASKFVTALERINAVGMALQIVDSISEEAQELRNKTRAELSIKLLSVFSARPADNKPAGKEQEEEEEEKEEG